MINLETDEYITTTQTLQKYQAKNYENINNAQYIYLLHFYIFIVIHLKKNIYHYLSL